MRACLRQLGKPDFLREPAEGKEKDLEADLLAFAAGHETVSTQQLLQAFVHTAETRSQVAWITDEIWLSLISAPYIRSK